MRKDIKSSKLVQKKDENVEKFEPFFERHHQSPINASLALEQKTNVAFCTDHGAAEQHCK